MTAPIVARQPRRMRQIRAALSLLVALAFLAFAFYKAYGYLQSDHGTTVGSSSCMTGSAKAPVALPKDTTVNVYNATTQAGLAAEVARKLRDRGFVIGEVDNDPLKKKISGVGEIRYGSEGREEARAVSLALPDAKRVNDKRTDAVIDLAVGAKFVDLAAPPTCS